MPDRMRASVTTALWLLLGALTANASAADTAPAAPTAKPLPPWAATDPFLITLAPELTAWQACRTVSATWTLHSSSAGQPTVVSTLSLWCDRQRMRLESAGDPDRDRIMVFDGKDSFRLERDTNELHIVRNRFVAPQVPEVPLFADFEPLSHWFSMSFPMWGAPLSLPLLNKLDAYAARLTSVWDAATHSWTFTYPPPPAWTQVPAMTVVQTSGADGTVTTQVFALDGEGHRLLLRDHQVTATRIQWVGGVRFLVPSESYFHEYSAPGVAMETIEETLDAIAVDRPLDDHLFVIDPETVTSIREKGHTQVFSQAR